MAGGVFSKDFEARVKALGDWRGATLSRVRELVKQADPEIVEEVKWRKPSNPAGVVAWSHDGLVCTGETYKDKVKVTFARGASLPDPKGVFNASLAAGTRRAVDIHEGDKIDATAFKALIRAAVGLNAERAPKKGPAATKKRPASAQPKLLSGGNPQIPKGDGDGPVQAYIAAMPGWKQDVGKRLDALIERAVPDVQKAVRWNSPFYGIEGKGWFLSFHCFTRYVKVTFLRGAALRPVPPVGSKDPNTRYYHIPEDGGIDEKQFVRWVKQAAKNRGDPLF